MVKFSNTESIHYTQFNRSLDLEVSYNYSHDAGCDRHSNGDPGDPPVTELEITEITCDGESIIPVFERMDRIFGEKSCYESVFTSIENELECEPPEPDFDEPDYDFDEPDYAEFYDGN